MINVSLWIRFLENTEILYWLQWLKTEVMHALHTAARLSLTVRNCKASIKTLFLTYCMSLCQNCHKNIMALAEKAVNLVMNKMLRINITSYSKLPGLYRYYFACTHSRGWATGMCNHAVLSLQLSTGWLFPAKPSGCSSGLFKPSINLHRQLWSVCSW